MRNYTFVLSSTQVLSVPKVLDHYLFLDPVYGVNFTYPFTANGEFFTSTSWPVTAYGGLIFPWGFAIQKYITFLSAGPLKGPYTITFSPSAIDTSIFSVSKIIYDFGDNSDIVTIEKDIVPNLVGTFQWDGNPASVVLNHTYYPLDYGTTTYYPSITVINGDLSQNVYRVQIQLVPLSLYEYSSFRMLNALQPNIKKEETLGIFEVEDPTYVTNVKLLSAPDTIYGEPCNTLPTTIPGLNLWLDASDALTIDKNSANVVSVWRDKSEYGNDFIQETANNRPVFIYGKDTNTNRKSLRFTATSLDGDLDAKFLQCTKTDTLSSVSSGYTAIFVMSPKNVEGTVISKGDALSSRNFLFRFVNNPPGSIFVANGGTGKSIEIQNISPDLSAYGLYSVRVEGNLTKVTADTLSFAQLPSQSYDFNINNGRMTIGSEQYISSPVNSFALTNTEISEIIMYNRAISDTELENLSECLKLKWNIGIIPIATPTPTPTPTP